MRRQAGAARPSRPKPCATVVRRYDRAPHQEHVPGVLPLPPARPPRPGEVLRRRRPTRNPTRSTGRGAGTFRRQGDVEDTLPVGCRPKSKLCAGRTGARTQSSWAQSAAPKPKLEQWQWELMGRAMQSAAASGDPATCSKRRLNSWEWSHPRSTRWITWTNRVSYQHHAKRTWTCTAAKLDRALRA